MEAESDASNFKNKQTLEDKYACTLACALKSPYTPLTSSVRLQRCTVTPRKRCLDAVSPVRMLCCFFHSYDITLPGYCWHHHASGITQHSFVEQSCQAIRESTCSDGSRKKNSVLAPSHACKNHECTVYFTAGFNECAAVLRQSKYARIVAELVGGFQILLSRCVHTIHFRMK